MVRQEALPPYPTIKKSIQPRPACTSHPKEPAEAQQTFKTHRRLPARPAGRRAAGHRPGRDGLRRGRPGLRRRDDATTPTPTGQRQAVHRAARPTRRSAASGSSTTRDGDGVFDRSTSSPKTLVADGPRALEGRRLRRRDAGPLVPQGHRRRRQGRRPPEGLHGVSQVQRPGGDQQPPVGARPPDLRRGRHATAARSDAGERRRHRAGQDGGEATSGSTPRRAFEAISGGARFGHAFDDWGHRFICNIRNPIRHVVLEARYLARNPCIAVVSPLHDVAEAGDALPVFRISPPEPWRDRRASARRPIPTVASPRSELVAAGFVTVGHAASRSTGVGLPARVPRPGLPRRGRHQPDPPPAA